MADNKIPRTSSEPRSPETAAADAMATGAPVSKGSTSTPAARSFSNAPWVAVINSGDSHSWVATATAAASSGVSSTGDRA
ncbi:Uncharacterised protein [Mycobacterium tuberculosis]|uniref:Uncharacterized protein n=1 Tax=Mycobacterium tuberculosis TaxID=1773 RepID=A0A0T9G8B0_MYCTX|nr:hypothetical protein CAB90_02345 [Mycobacterium tuberculosis]CFE46440.1 Uncharacterised protein [Mycobacterium tuberculosis]CFS07565.1 Uncharacterised protein [Mycobacterium tuberculosis]CKR19472.1 Uncharacterised protein [Mycobacterium tuberculosis]CKT07339.1 Uncharacterised protein [Mycobacterium tuberculosis]